MNEAKLKRLLAQELPPVPESFHLAVTGTLNRIVAEEGTTRKLPPLRRTLLIAALMALMMATAAFAATHWQIFDGLWPFAKAPKGAEQVMQGHLAQETVNNVEITVEEAGYDGRSLLLVYSYRLLDTDALATPEQLRDHNVGWWIDHIWFDGKAMDMPGNSYGQTTMNAATGKLTEKQIYRLDNENVQLTGPVEISLPIGEKQPLEAYSRIHHPENYAEDGTLLLPKAGMVTFTLDTARQLPLDIATPNQPVQLDGFTAAVTEAAFSPLMTYLTLQLEVSPEALAAYKEANGEGYFDDEGNLIYAYDGSELVAPWLFDLQLVDGAGGVLTHEGGNNGYSADWAEFIYPAIEDLPEELWLAPVRDGQADMSRAVRVR
ncbi:MAG: hypothetical protein J6K73_08870 [Clostridia bacterium]|nr:hypothetical protein [Clostridia bacterium]